MTDGPTNATRPDGSRYYRGGCAAKMPRVGACRVGCLHRESVENYRAGRAAWEEAFEEATGSSYRPGIIAERQRAERRGGRNEVGDFVESTPPPTFRAWLEGRAGHNQEP